MTYLPRTREDILKELNEIKRDVSFTDQGYLTKAICVLAEIILDKDYDYYTQESLNDLLE